MALIITLLTLGLMTIIVVAFLGTMSWELTASRRDYDNQRSRAMATLGMNTAVAQLRLALGVWDNPFVNFTNTVQPTYYWSVSPGILTRWAYASTAPVTNYPLFSLDPNGATNLVNLNAQQADGTYPIIGGANPPNVSVYWANVLANPRLVVSAANPIVGRYAFWVDDENAKININTADGTLKYTANSLGLGTPSEVSLQALQQGGSVLSAAEATNIVYIARTTGFNSAREILRTPGSTPDLYTNNVFNLTTWGRSPELNVFGEPKINLISIAPAPTGIGMHGVLETNNITGQAMTEIYPTPAQLPPVRADNFNVGVGLNVSNSWRPLAMSSEWPVQTNARDTHGLIGDGETWVFELISMYLGGTNSVNVPITWPVFPGSGTPGGFLGKYSLKQLDALSAQITDLAGKMTVPEAQSVGGAFVPPLGTPSTPTGLLSRQVVCGLGRTAKINEIYISATAYGALTNGSSYQAPYLKMTVYLETYLPAGFAGVDLLNVNSATGLPPATANASGFNELGGQSGLVSYLNLLDLPTSKGGDGFPGVNNPPIIPNTAIPATNYSAIYRTNYTVGTTNNFWQDCVLQNDQGIDFLGNPPGTSIAPLADPDQARAAVYHSYLTNAAGLPSVGGINYPGNGINPNPTTTASVLSMGYLSAGTAGTTIWYPGQYRTVINNYSAVHYGMTNADSGTTLHIFGGLIATGQMHLGTGDPDPTPFEAGVQANPNTPGQGNLNWDSYDASEKAGNASNYWYLAPANPNQTTYPTNPSETTRDRLVNGAIPVNITLTVPAASASILASGGPTVTYDVAVADPLVNKFPGDWIPTTNTAPTMGGGGGVPTMIPNGNDGSFAVYYNGQNFTTNTVYSTYYDPDSFWMPTLDPKIPRSARFPNIGYLNYLRTGVFPDDETVPIGQQHGTPYRCLNFNAASDPSQTLSVAGTTGNHSYPDWALLDLFTMPSTLLPYGGPYGYYKYPNGTNAGTATWTAGSIMKGNPTNMYYYGTWGGSTPGRINPNGAVIYTTNVTTPTPGITRPLPLEALLYGLTNNATLTSGLSAATATTNAPTAANYTGGAAVDYAGTANAIVSYLTNNGPLREPAEICNIPTVSAYSAIPANVGGDANHYNPTRNDLVRQIVGNLTTQSNVFSVWVEGQTITKSKANMVANHYGIYDPGDQITGSVRYHFVVERYLQAGAGGVYGNTQDPLQHYSTAGVAAYPSGGLSFTNAVGDVDGIVGTYDDPADPAYHPVNPRYLYRVVYAEEIRD